jgi:cell division protein FtsN
VSSDDVELGTQFDYFIAQCNRLPAPAAATPDSAAAAPASTTTGPQFSVQVAAYTARQDAVSLVSNLKGRGFDARIVGTRSPYRVRIGRYASKADATQALARMKPSGSNWIVVEAEPR